MEHVLTTGQNVRKESKALKLVVTRRWWRIAVAAVIVLIVAVAFGLALIPWQQSVSGVGKVMVFDPAARPQNIEAQIPGRIVSWNVWDGKVVKQNDIIAVLDDIDSKFLNPNLVKQTRQQRAYIVAQRQAVEAQRDAAKLRLARLQEQFQYLTKSRNVALPVAGERAKRTTDMMTAAVENQRQSERSRDAIRDALIPAAEEKVAQSEESKLAAEQVVRAARQRLETEKLRRERVRQLFEKLLRSKQDDEFAERDLIVAQTEVERSERSLDVAGRAVNVAKADLNRARIDLLKAANEIANRLASVEAAKRDRSIGFQDVSQVNFTTAAQLSSLEAGIQSANETIAKAAETTAKANETLTKLDQDLQNLQLRNAQQIVRAPSDGRIVRLMKFGAGATVKANDVLAVLAPTTKDIAVEMIVSDNDAPLIDVGRRVRLQFAGWPALQFTGFPSVATGTFGGIVTTVDAIDDGKSRFRLIVKPDHERVSAGKDQEWPPLDRLRPGAKAVGWVMLDRVSLGWELWRQFNAFPPTVSRNLPVSPGGKDGATVTDDEKKDYDKEDKDEFTLKAKAPK